MKDWHIKVEPTISDIIKQIAESNPPTKNPKEESNKEVTHDNSDTN